MKGLVANLILAVIKFFAGFVGHSHAVMADAVHTLADSITDIAILVGSMYWSRPSDHAHPYGHRRIETMVTMFIGVALLLTGLGIGYESLRVLTRGVFITPGWPAIVAALLSLIVKEILYRWTSMVGKEVRSSALLANAWHHRTDAISSLPVFLAVGGTMIFPAWPFLDQIGAVIVSLFIIHAAFKTLAPGFMELIETGVPSPVKETIRETAESVPGVIDAHDIRTRYLGSRIFTDLHITVEGSLTVTEGHSIAKEVRILLQDSNPDILEVIVHIDPSN